MFKIVNNTGLISIVEEHHNKHKTICMLKHFENSFIEFHGNRHSVAYRFKIDIHTVNKIIDEIYRKKLPSKIYSKLELDSNEMNYTYHGYGGKFQDFYISEKEYYKQNKKQ